MVSREYVMYSPLGSTKTLPRKLTSPFLNSQLFLFITGFGIALTIFYLSVVQQRFTEERDQLVKEAIELGSYDARFAERYRNKGLLSNKMKYILLWTPDNRAPFDYLGKGQESFKKNKCQFTNCFVTSDKNYFKGDLTKFDAIAFHGLDNVKPLPLERSLYQKYIHFNMESAANYPICAKWNDGFYNWTATYKLNSDIVYAYLLIRNSKGEIVGPRTNMEWIADMKEIDDDFKKKLKTKHKAAAWFVSNCYTISNRESYVRSLQNALAAFNMTVDIYGNCGSFHCPRQNEQHCYTLLEKDYYFYLSFENSFAEDYVTEKVLTAVQHDAVPIVYGGADYSRFLPPGSYLDARKQDPKELADMMYHIIENPALYHEFFKWRNHYSYSKSEAVEDVCKVCAALNNETKVFTPQSYKELRSWWYPDFERVCKQY